VETHQVPRRLAALAAVVIGFAGGAACGTTGSSTPSSAESLRVGQLAFRGDLQGVTDAIRVCVGRSLIEDVGVTNATKDSGVSDFSKLGTTDRKAVVAAMDKCVDGQHFSVMFVNKMAQAAGSSASVDDQLINCVASNSTGKVGESLVSFGTPQQKDTLAVIFKGCPSDSIVKPVLKKALTDQGADPAMAECVASALAKQITMTDMLQGSDAVKNAVSAHVAEARLACGAGG
jgi:hypothetical protein